MGAVSLNEINVTPLKRISTLRGDVVHAMKRTDPQYMGFGEAYFSWIEAGVVKAWKCHQQTSLYNYPQNIRECTISQIKEYNRLAK